jgi:hypothetical protein
LGQNDTFVEGDDYFFVLFPILDKAFYNFSPYIVQGDLNDEDKNSKFCSVRVVTE